MNNPQTRDALIAALTQRLRAICSGWPDAEFNALVGQIADITLKYEGRTTEGTYDRRSAEKLIAELKAVLDRSQSKRDEQPGGGGGEGSSVAVLILALREFLLADFPRTLL